MKIDPETGLKDLVSADISLSGVLARFGILPGYGSETIAEVSRRTGIHQNLLVAIVHCYFSTYGNLSSIGESLVSKLPDEATEKFLRESNEYYLRVELPLIARHIAHAGLRSDRLDIYIKELERLLQNRQKLYEENIYPILSNIQIGRGKIAISEERDACDMEIESRLEDLKNFFIVHQTPTVSPGILLGVLATIEALLKDFKATTRLVRLIEADADKKDNPAEAGISDTAEVLPISQREREVLVLLAKGLSNKEVADRLNISINTAITHRRNLSSKLGIRSIAGLSLFAYTHGMLGD